ncbi:MAG TPA: DUF2279 domain-containing protein [Kofleriaceae bacterium]|nr:DUF2279 domain-containing protein [Kofleriaceae bacterium]
MFGPSRSADSTRTDHRLESGLAVAGLYAGFSAWAYIAWYRNHPEKDEHDFGRDGWFGKHTYAGGADKLGHAWATMVLARGGTAALRAGGWDRTKSALVSATLSEGLFFAVEVKDYFYYEFSPGDFTFNTLGALTALALDLSPRLDELFDYRVEYWFSDQYLHNLFDSDSPCAKRVPGQPSCSRWNIAEDYSAEKYLIALHLGAIRPIRDLSKWSRFVDVDVGFYSRNYKPPPTLEPNALKTQTLFLGVSLNAQGVVDALLPHESKLRKTGHGFFEVVGPPMTIGVGAQRSTSRVNTGGA